MRKKGKKRRNVDFLSVFFGKVVRFGKFCVENRGFWGGGFFCYCGDFLFREVLNKKCSFFFEITFFFEV